MGFWGKGFAAVCIAALSACEQVSAPSAPAPTQAPAPTENSEPSERPAVGSEIVGIASVIDGDTIDIHETRIRMFGYDAPERGARCGTLNVFQVASNELAARIDARTVTCTVTGWDARNRGPVAQCSVGGQDLGEWMVSEGFARDWPQYSSGEYADEEARARAAQAGVWAATCGPDIWPDDRDYSPR